MNLYKYIIIICLFKNYFCFYIKSVNIKPTNLFMKKKQNVVSNLYNPKTAKQATYVKYLDENEIKIIVSLGPAGTGKTLFACQKAITQYKSESINKIIITRPVVTVEEEIGFLPGNIIKKMDPWTKPIFDIFLEYFSKTELDQLLSNNKIEICPLAFMRGRTFKNAFIIADEMQNSSPNQMKMLTTRLGDNCRLVITGDLHQSDIKSENGLNDLLIKINNYKSKNNITNIDTIEFDNLDIERSEIVKKVIEIYDYNSTKKSVSKHIVKKTNNRPNIIDIITDKQPERVEEKKYNMDAALIPKHHISRNSELFFDSHYF